MKKIYGTLGLLVVIAFLPLTELHAQTACSGTPGTNVALASQTIVCPGSTVSLSLLNSYSVTGLTFQWQSATASQVGPYTNLPGATLNTYTTNPLFTSTYFQCVITCTAVAQSTTASFVYILVAPALTTSTVPYYEDFEGISYNNQLPNCSWLAPNIGSTFHTYTSSLTNNRVPCSGSRFCGFSLPSSSNTAYTNGIQMFPGTTYSAAVFYKTEYLGATNWTKLELLVGPNQNTTGLALITSTSPAVSGPCKLLSGTFTVASAGLYYVAMRTTAVGGSALYLTLDDLSVTAPCALPGNSSTISIAPNNFTVCEGEVVTFTASGASNYTWSSGAVGPVYTATITGLFSLSVSSSATVSGCTSTRNVTLSVNPNPSVFGVLNKPAICPGETAIIAVYGGSSYTVSPGSVTITSGSPSIPVSPTVSTCYTITGANTYSCASKSLLCLQVHTLPTITVGYAPQKLCAGEEVVLTGSGAQSYQWWNGFPPGNPVKANPLTTTLYSVTGTGANGCQNTSTISVTVNPCTDIEKNAKNAETFSLHPNPTKGEFRIESSTRLSGFRVTIIDALGRITAECETKDTTLKLNLSHLPPGIYYARIEYLNSVEVIRVIKE